MALANVTARAAMAMEEMLLLLDNSTYNGSGGNTTLAVAHYPSGYTLPQIVVASIVVTLLMIVVVVGNMLVIIAITTEKALKNIQNWFIASLAVADFFLGLVIMPFSLANELMGYWIFGAWWCDVHSAMDVLLSTASIMNLCLISLDRYWSITQAVEYLKKRTPVRAVVMITAVWLLSALICIPPLLGWKVERAPDEQYPKCQVFSKVKKLRPNCLSKIVAIKGDISTLSLDLNPEDIKTLQKRVNVIIHGAATVRFDEKLREAVKINIRGTLEIIELARKCENLQSFVHISTAFSNCPREEIDELFYDPPFSVEEIIDIVDRNTDDTLKLMQSKLLGKFPNTYSFTKCIAESIIRKNSEVLPISVFRPSIVISTYREPLKSWIDNLYGPIGLAIGTGVGLIHTVHSDLSKVSDLVPCDFVANAIIAVAYKTSQKNSQKVYNYVSSVENPITWGYFEKTTSLQGTKTPAANAIYFYCCYYTKYKLLHLFLALFLHFLPGLIGDVFFTLRGDKPKLIKAYKKVQKYNNLLEFFSTQEWTFKNENIQNLWKSLSEEDKEAFTFSMKELDWDIYTVSTLLGCRVHLLKEDLSTIPAGRKKYRMFQLIHYVIKYSFLLICVWSLYVILTKCFQF